MKTQHETRSIKFIVQHALHDCQLNSPSSTAGGAGHPLDERDPLKHNKADLKSEKGRFTLRT